MTSRIIFINVFAGGCRLHLYCQITGLAALELHPIDLSSATETPSPDVGFSGKRRLRGRRGSLSNSVSPMRALSLSLSGSETPGSRRGGSRGPNVFDELDAASTELLSILRKVVVKQGDGTRRAASVCALVHACA